MLHSCAGSAFATQKGIFNQRSLPTGFAMSVLAVLAFAFVGVVGTLLIIIVVVFVIDRLQTGDAIRGNYPVLGRFWHLSSQVGEFFASFSLRWIARNCYSIARSTSGSSAPVKVMKIL
jgi:hypothetical protein